MCEINATSASHRDWIDPRNYELEYIQYNLDNGTQTCTYKVLVACASTAAPFPNLNNP
jgi:hypothetical protein